MPTPQELQKQLLLQQKTLQTSTAQLKNATQDKLAADNSILKITEAIAKAPPKYKSSLQQKAVLMQADQLKKTTEVKNLTAAVAKLQKELEDLLQQLGKLGNAPEEEIFSLSKKITALDDHFPILLFPVRLETRFHKDGAIRELWIRVYPDTCLSEVDRNYLTPNELASAISFLQNAATDLQGKHGTNRANFIRQWVEKNKGDTSFLDRIIKNADNDIEKNFGVAITEQAPVPRTSLLPDKFVFRLFNSAGSEVKTEVGKQVPASVMMGFAKQNQSGIDWMHNFEQAVGMGLGLKISLTDAEYTAGFSKMLVLGIKTGQKVSPNLAADSQQQLENLFENHFYSGDGLSLLKQGTPTNNSDEASTVYSGDNRGNTQPATPGAPVLIPENTEETSRDFNDGIWLSQYLGIDDNLFQKVENGQGTDQREARLMNIALFKATLGYYMEEMLDPLIGDRTLSMVESFFTKYVLGRGTIPSIRIGKQPYGILPVSLAGKLEFSSEVDRNKIVRKVQQLSSIWKNAATTLKSVNNRSAISPEDFYGILSLHPNSVSFSQRYAEDLGPRLNAVNAAYGNTGIVEDPNEVQEDIFVKDTLIKLLTQLGLDADTDRPDIIFKFFREATSLKGPVIESARDEAGLVLNEMFSEKEPLKFNYIEWLYKSDFETLRKQTGVDFKGRSPLLYLLLRHALMLRYTEAAKSMERRATKASSKDINNRYRDNQLFDSVGQSKMALMYRADEKITGSPTQQVKDAIKSQLAFGVPFSLESMQLKYTINALKALNELKPSTADLERVFAEHIDCCTYRIDAWINGLYSAQLRNQRTRKGTNAWSKGLYLGAYGYVEDLKPRGSRTSEGYILAPSLNHAAAGAVLKNAQLTYSGNANNPFTINISSERVRMAKQVMDGVRNGQGLSELLGYRFERKLHDKQLDRYLLEFRKKYPLVSMDGKPVANGAVPSIVARNVADGLKLLNGYEKDTNDFIAAADKNTVGEIVNYLQNLLDAVKDIMMTEGIYQAVSGQYERGSAMLDSLSQGKYGANPEVLTTPRTGTLLTHRVALQIPYVAQAVNAASFRALLEPSLNAWLRSVLPDPSVVVVTIHAQSDMSDPGKIVTQQELGIEPIDLLYLLDGDDTQAVTRLHEVVISSLPLNEQVRSIQFKVKKDPAQFTLFELSALMRPIRKLLLKAAYLSPGNLSYKTSDAMPEPNTVSADHLERLNKLLTQLNIDLSYFSNLDAEDTTVIRTHLLALARQTSLLFAHEISFSSDLENLSDNMLPVSETMTLKAGIQQRVKAFSDQLAKQRKALVRIIQHLKDELQNKGAGSGKPYSYPDFLEELKTALGEDVMMLPSYKYSPVAAAEVSTQLSGNTLLDFSRNDLKTGFPVEQWVNGLARVREQMKMLETVIDLTAVVTGKPLQFSPLQLPYAAGDPWMAVQFSNAAKSFNASDKLLYTIVSLQKPAATDPVCGFMLDEWTETIPNKEEIAGLSFHYNRPNMEAPQTMLLATPPEITGSWSFENIADSVLAAFELAKIRAVDPAELDKSALGQFLPATMLYASFYDTSVTTNLAQNM